MTQYVIEYTDSLKTLESILWKESNIDAAALLKDGKPYIKIFSSNGFDKKKLLNKIKSIIINSVPELKTQSISIELSKNNIVQFHCKSNFEKLILFLISLVVILGLGYYLSNLGYL